MGELDTFKSKWAIIVWWARFKFHYYIILCFFISVFFSFCLCSSIVQTPGSLKHLIWDCPRSARVWKLLNNLTKDLLGGEYINYNTVILGNSKPLMAMETIIVWALKLITKIDRDSFISNEVITQKLSNLLHYERKTFSKNSKKFLNRWGNLIHLKVNEQ